MRFEIQLRVVADDGRLIQDHEALVLDKADTRLEAIGLSLAEGKTLLHRLQQRIVAAQAGSFVDRCRRCSECGCPLRSKGRGTLLFRSAFGDVPVASPRFHRCTCRAANSKTFSPLTRLFTEHTAPELLYLESKWASLVSYGLTVDLLKEVLPMRATTNAETIRRHLHQVAARTDAELGDEQPSFVDGCPSIWNELPHPEGPIVVGIDGGFVRNWHDKANHFEVVVGKSVPEDRGDRYFGFVQNHDTKPKRRLFEILQGQGLQMNQEITFLTDGGDSVRELAERMSPCAEHILDWFHLTMRLTVLGQYAKGLKHHDPEQAEEAEAQIERIKWYLWNGNVREALFWAECLADDLDGLTSDYPGMKRFARTAAEFHTYIANNAGAIPNYAERWRYGERVATSFVESTVNLVVGKRFAKRQQMQWSPRGAHLLLQTRTRVLDGTLRATFARWYPGLAANTENGRTPAAAA
jgi:hypothetical protein